MANGSQSGAGDLSSGFAICGDLILVKNTELRALELSSGRETGTLFVEQYEFLWSDFGAENRRAFVVGNSAVYGLRCS